ncbi:MAG: SDR family NAD(P)-dependent oxidoreductase, partial [Pseudomonadota bacterium]
MTQSGAEPGQKLPVAPLVFITGASSGLGQALALLYARQGWRLALVARRVPTLQAWAQAQGWPADQWAVYGADVRVEAEMVA